MPTRSLRHSIFYEFQGRKKRHYFAHLSGPIFNFSCQTQCYRIPNCFSRTHLGGDFHLRNIKFPHLFSQSVCLSVGEAFAFQVSFSVLWYSFIWSLGRFPHLCVFMYTVCCLFTVSERNQSSLKNHVTIWVCVRIHLEEETRKLNPFIIWKMLGITETPLRRISETQCQLIQQVK